MWRLSFIIVDTISAAIFIIPLMLLWFFVFSKETAKLSRFLYLIFGCFLAAVFSAVGVPSISDLTFDISLNLIPFYGMSIEESLLNVVLFVPLGFFLPILSKKFRSIKTAILTGISLSLFIEIVQIFTLRTTDINDLITNTLGTLLGYLFAVFVDKLAKGRLMTEKCDDSIKNFFASAIIAFTVVFTVVQYAALMFNTTMFFSSEPF